MRDIPANIIHERRDALIVLKEKKSKTALLNPDKKLYHEVKVDGDLYAATETTERKCDEQLLSTIQNVNVGIIRKKTAIVVTPHIPKSNLKFQKYEKLCHKQGAELKVVNSGCTFHLYK